MSMAYKRPVEIPCTACHVEAGVMCRTITHEAGVVGNPIAFFHAARIDAAFETFIPRCVGCGEIAHPGEFCKDIKKG